MSILETGLLITTVLCIAANGFEVAAKAVKAQFVVQNSGEVGLAPRWLPYLAVIEGAGVVGLVIGFAGVRQIGLAAAIGLVAFFIGAVGAHIRSNVLHNIVFPGVFLALALGSVAYFALPA
ncbi:DoxX family protein [Mycobacteroides abscessus]|uniref:DoxX family protein n=1 Tax=Mycobacteroides abscessus TaxID=36809 RepID=UPI000925B65C|nr:DoxX family protein [Mycobacteroides abscessus]SKU01926.1 putative invasion protein [Mycobacteroides abscessus subsp. abscessus]SHT81360.1 putative invasion protein [Mycobacteroides abscessus subsp. bolletii]SHX45329.1 putative invasion protein [Mycobacteroides abscessus subsp. bolletii]SHX50804.1 putative invasion protein [Mycobacteroides abscessus subsp. bolletii]SHX98710.1 putative invasion protein [Mycobacteroides abscessus subsp. bolletii]